MLDWEEQQHEGGVEGFSVWDTNRGFIIGCHMQLSISLQNMFLIWRYASPKVCFIQFLPPTLFVTLHLSLALMSIYYQ